MQDHIDWQMKLHIKYKRQNFHNIQLSNIQQHKKQQCWMHIEYRHWLILNKIHRHNLLEQNLFCRILTLKDTQYIHLLMPNNNQLHKKKIMNQMNIQQNQQDILNISFLKCNIHHLHNPRNIMINLNNLHMLMKQQ